MCTGESKPLRINILDSFNGAMDKNTIEYIHTLNNFAVSSTEHNPL